MKQLLRRAILWALGDVSADEPRVAATLPPRTERPHVEPVGAPPIKGGIQTCWLDSDAEVSNEAVMALPPEERDRVLRQRPRCLPGDHYVSVWPKCFLCGADASKEVGDYARLSVPASAAAALVRVLRSELESVPQRMAEAATDPDRAQRVTLEANAWSSLIEAIEDQCRPKVAA